MWSCCELHCCEWHCCANAVLAWVRAWQQQQQSRAAAAADRRRTLALTKPPGIQDARDRLSAIQRVAETVWASQRYPGLLLVSRRGAVYRTVDDGRSWSQVQGLPPTYDFTLVDATSMLVAATEQGLYLSDDRGVTWRQGDSALRDVPVVDLDSSGSILYAALAVAINA